MKESPIAEEYVLAFCEACGRMTNHKDGECAKHKKPGYDVAENFTVKGWEELGKVIATGSQLERKEQ